MPPVGSIPMALIFYYLFSLILGGLFQSSFWVGPTFSGFILGYLTYVLTHYATHHFPMRLELLQRIKRHHMKHHYSGQTGRYGVSSPLWDIVFRTNGR
jgi:sterol desaturase/sphingolipid hydroxylase (fatty acid hydroxylase superfamily)